MQVTSLPGRSRVLSLVVMAVIMLGPLAPQALGAVSEFATPTAGAAPTGIVTGPDGNLWVAEARGSRIARVTPTGAMTEFTLPAGREPFDLAVSGGLLYFTERTGDRIGRIDPGAGGDAAIQASVAEFAVPGAGSGPTGIAAGSDGNLWFTQPSADQIGRLTPAGTITEFAVPGAGSGPLGIVAGPDGALWFTERGSSEIGSITTGGVFAEFRVPSLLSEPNDLGAITVGPDGALWFAVPGVDQIGRITTAGEQSRFAAGNAVEGLVTGSDGALWFTAGSAGRIGRMTTAGTVAEYSLADPISGPSGITAGPDGALWFTERFASKVGAITTDTAPDPPAVPPTGPSGEPGPPGADAGLSVVAFQVKPKRPVVGRRVKVRFAITGAAAVSLAVARGKGPGGEIVAANAVGAAGSGKLTWNGTLNGEAAKAGRYLLTVIAQSGEQSSESSIRTRLRRR